MTWWSAAWPPSCWLFVVVVLPRCRQSSFRNRSVAVHEQTARLQRREQARQEHVKAWRFHPVGEALQALRGGDAPSP